VILSSYKEDEKDFLKAKKKKSKKEEDVIFEKQFGKTNPVQELIDHGLLEIGSLQHTRGRSLKNQFMLVDESQNLTKNSLKTIISRAGEGTKIILMADTQQIDSPYLDSKNNGFTYVSEKFKNQNIYAHITLKKSERSELAELATELL
jgi:PhoH-like ATPase